MVDCESLRKLAGIATRRPKNLPRVFVLVGIVGPGWFLEFDEGKMMGDATVEELMNLVEGYAALMKQAERGDATEAQCDEIWSAIRRIATMLESASAKKAKRLEDALRGMIEAHLLEDYSNSGHYLDLCGQAWMKARDVLGEECDGVVTPNA